MVLKVWSGGYNKGSSNGGRTAEEQESNLINEAIKEKNQAKQNNKTKKTNNKTKQVTEQTINDIIDRLKNGDKSDISYIFQKLKKNNYDTKDIQQRVNQILVGNQIVDKTRRNLKNKRYL